jgi:hypothetical protein
MSSILSTTRAALSATLGADGSVRDVLEAAAGDDALARALARVLAERTGRSSSGFPYLAPRAWEIFRDSVPHLFAFGTRVLDAAARLAEASEASSLGAEAKASVRDGATVLRQIVLTATITAPPDLWLLRHVLGFFSDLGLLDRLRAGESLNPEACDVIFAGKRRELHPGELDKDLLFLLSRGLVDQYDEGYRIAGHPRVHRILAATRPLGPGVPASATPLWRRLFSGEVLGDGDIEVLLDIGHAAPRRTSAAQNHWICDPDELELGHRLLPIVLALRATSRSRELVTGADVVPSAWSEVHPSCASAALEVLTAAGWMHRRGERYVVSPLGARGFARGPGPFGIIETYHPYMGRGRDILLEGPGSISVTRSENVGASQDANSATFEQANESLDRFCAATGFRYRVFIEHAIGRGEATRQRYARSGASLKYVGADLEDAAIEAALEERARGALPAEMLFVPRADIGRPEALLAALRERSIDPYGAVMLVGNGFHEVRGQTDNTMTEVFRGYHEAGVVLLFTEESALSIDDLRATAWNTYHAGFRYVHDKSGQALRPAEPNPDPPRLGHALRAAWSECARRAGYVRADAFCTRTRTIYPYTPKNGHNPSISVNHFFVPSAIAAALGL